MFSTEDLAAEMRQWRARPMPPIPTEAPMPTATAALLGCDTPVGRASYDRLNAWRSAGYTGPLDPEGNIPDPDDPANADIIAATLAIWVADYRQAEADDYDLASQVQDREAAFERGEITVDEYRNWTYDYGIKEN